MPLTKNEPGSGIAFLNDRDARKGAPHYTGRYTDADGKELKLAVWLKKGARGGKFLTIQTREVE